LKVACLEEIAYGQGWIDRDCLLRQAKAFGKTGYGQYLFSLAEEASASRPITRLLGANAS
ncbi:hypothetical protein FB481_1141, partial [Pseudomonas sp. AG1028]